MLVIALLALFGNAGQYQSGFNFCVKHDFKFKECSFHKEMVMKNPRSIYYDKVQK